jgi:hypothetical protein
MHLMPNGKSMNFTVQAHHAASAVPEMAVFCVVASCSLVEVYEHLRGACSLHYFLDSVGSKHL